MTAEIGDLVVKECKASEFQDCDIVFSGLDSDVAGDIGMFLTCRIWRVAQWLTDTGAGLKKWNS
jgi:hypothetical protein